MKLLTIIFLLASFSSFASFHKERLSDIGTTYEKAHYNFNTRATRSLQGVYCKFESQQKQRSNFPYQIYNVIYNCLVPNGCRVMDIADEAAMWSSEYVLMCN